jgi:thiamine biosynthesis lipoprotein
MGTFARITAAAESPEKAELIIERAFSALSMVDELMSDYKPDSEISEINRFAYEKPVKVSEKTYEVLKNSVRYSELTDGAFDITVGGVVQLWRKIKSGEIAEIPESRKQSLSETIGWEKLLLNDKNRTVRIANANTKIDLGGIAKGYAIDRAVEAMKECGCEGGIVDVGGDVRCFAKPAEARRFWNVAIQNPDTSASGQTVMTLKLKNGAAATSGNYRRFYKKDDKIFSHIIDTRKGWSNRNPSSVTVIADKAIQADVFATAVSVMGIEEGMEFVNRTEGVEAIIIDITADGKLQVYKSDRAQAYIK